MNTVNEYQLLAAGLALFISTIGFLSMFCLFFVVMTNHIVNAINKESSSFTINYAKFSLFAFLFIISLITFIRLMFIPFAWYSI